MTWQFWVMYAPVVCGLLALWWIVLKLCDRVEAMQEPGRWRDR
jgi:hypothetical protein